MNIDALYGAFCDRLSPSLRRYGRGLPKALELAPSADVPWSAVFKHEITLAAPGLIAQALPRIPIASIEQATIAHMLSIIEAFGTDRIADGQVSATPELSELLSAMRTARDGALHRIGGDRAVDLAHAADRRSHAAIAAERALFTADEPVSFETYIEVSSGKQAVGITASVVLATAGACDDAETGAVDAALLGSALGLQFQDDVVDWEDDAQRGGAWALLLARGVSPGDRTPTREARQVVASSSVLVSMLELSRQHFGQAAAASRALGATRLAAWAEERAAESAERREGENRSPGYVSRFQKLAAWRAAVIG